MSENKSGDFFRILLTMLDGEIWYLDKPLSSVAHVETLTDHWLSHEATLCVCIYEYRGGVAIGWEEHFRIHEMVDDCF